MTVAWCVFGFVQLATNRYLRGRLWKSAMLIHALTGYAMFGMTLWSAYYAVNGFDWDFARIIDDVPIHFVLAVPVITIPLLIVIGGSILRIQVMASRWNTKFTLRFRATHRYSGFFFIFLGQVTVLT